MAHTIWLFALQPLITTFGDPRIIKDTWRSSAVMAEEPQHDWMWRAWMMGHQLHLGHGAWQPPWYVVICWMMRYPATSIVNGRQHWSNIERDLGYSDTYWQYAVLSFSTASFWRIQMKISIAPCFFYCYVGVDHVVPFTMNIIVWLWSWGWIEWKTRMEEHDMDHYQVALEAHGRLGYASLLTWVQSCHGVSFPDWFSIAKIIH